MASCSVLLGPRVVGVDFRRGQFSFRVPSLGPGPIIGHQMCNHVRLLAVREQPPLMVKPAKYPLSNTNTDREDGSVLSEGKKIAISGHRWWCW